MVLQSKDLTSLLSRYNLQQSIFAGLSRLGSEKDKLNEHRLDMENDACVGFGSWLTCEHGYDAQNNLFDALYRAPTFRGEFVLCGIISGGMEDRDTDSSVRVNYRKKKYIVCPSAPPPRFQRDIGNDNERAQTVGMEQRGVKLHLEGREWVIGWLSFVTA